jgi:Fic family protein
VPVDYFQFYNAVSSVYSSKIEGENIDFDSFYKHKFLNVKYKPDYTKRSDDLVLAYEFTLNNKLNLDNLLKAHSILSKNLLPKSHRGTIRTNQMFVLNSDDRIEYVAAKPEIVKYELENLFSDISILTNANISLPEAFYYAAYIHLIFVKIHPFQDGNGRTGRLLEKWFLIEKLGRNIVSIELEKNYYKNLSYYYKNIRKLGLEYSYLDYSQSLDFLTMTIMGLKDQTNNH